MNSLNCSIISHPLDGQYSFDLEKVKEDIAKIQKQINQDPELANIIINAAAPDKKMTPENFRNVEKLSKLVACYLYLKKIDSEAFKNHMKLVGASLATGAAVIGTAVVVSALSVAHPAAPLILSTAFKITFFGLLTIGSATLFYKHFQQGLKFEDARTALYEELKSDDIHHQIENFDKVYKKILDKHEQRSQELVKISQTEQFELKEIKKSIL